MIPAAAVLLSERADAALASLEADPSPQSKSIARRARALKPLLLVDCLDGEVVPRKAIPTALVARYGLENLYVEDLPSFWRLLYTIAKHDGRRVIVVVEIVDHRQYSKWFPGRRR
jgi:hypothetical protein